MDTPSKVIARCNSIKSNWGGRHRKFVEWYDVLTLKDDLQQEGMESVVSNDPRTGYNLGKHLLTSSVIAHKVVDTDLEPDEVPGVSYLEGYMEQRWSEQERRYRQMGRRGWIDELNAFMLAVGWYAAFAMVDENRVWAEVWHPAEVFPDYSSDGIAEVAHIYSLTAPATNRKIKTMGWPVQPVRGRTTIYDYWGFDNDSDVVNGIVVGSQFAKPLVKDANLSKLGVLPVFTGPVGGLPDRGTIQSGAEWQKHCGESIVATNEDLGKNYNKMLSFTQQMMRDTANHRWLELSSGDTPILKEADMKKHGAIFRGEPGESVQPLAAPPIPLELRTVLFDYQNMLQRGLFPWSTFGNVQQQMSYLAMANIASASLQVLAPYSDGLRGLLTDIDNFWYRMMKENNLRPHKFKMPEEMPDNLQFDTRADIEIPGYLVQRATVARMLDPQFKLSTDTVIGRLFPEIRDPIKEQAKARKDMAMSHPKAVMVDQIIAYREQAAALREAGNVDGAKLYEKLADSLERELEAPEQPPPPEAGPGAPEGILREVMPAEVTRPQEGMGRV